MRTSLLTFALLLLTTGASLAGILRVGTWSSSGATPHSSLTSALAAAKPGDDIWVAKGLYQEAEYIIPFGVRLFGGFSGTETQASERDYAANVTILDGSGAHRVATVSGLLDGFTLRNGRTGDNGGGAYVKIGGQISHCILFANEAGYDGGAIFIEPSVTNTLLTGNRAGNDGSGISGTRGYSAANLTVAGNAFTGKPEVKKALPVPATLSAGEVLDVAEPDILNPDEVDPHGSTILLKGWELDGHAIPMPYTVTYADNGKMLRFWAANAVGVGVSNGVALTVTWTVTSSVQILTPKAVCEGSTLADAGISNPAFSPIPDGGGATYSYFIDGAPVISLNYALQYSDNGKLLTCQIKNGDGSIVGATTPAVRLAVMKAPDVLLSTVPALSVEEGQPLCLPAPVVLSHGSDVTAQGWKWRVGAGGENIFNSCDKATTAMNGATLYYTAENGCSTTPTATTYTTLTVTNPVGEFLQTVSALCTNMPLDDCISFTDGGNTGDYYIGNTYIGKAGEEGNFTTSWDDVKTTVLTTAHNLQVLRFSYNGGQNERRMTLTVHAVPEITIDPVTPAALCLGDAHTLTIEATGDNLSYQWERSINSTDGLDGSWSGVPGSTTAACRLTADVSAYYRCTVTGVCIDKSAAVSGGKITSSSVKLTVNDCPVIPDVTFAAADLNICAGVEISTLLAGKAPTLTGSAALDEGWTLGGIKIAANYKVLSTDNGKVLGYWASNACGERTATFPTGILAVTPRPELLQSPADMATEENSSVRLSVLTGAGVKYEWYKAGSVAGDPTNGATLIGGATSSSYVFTAEELKGTDLTNGQKATEYYCKVIATTDVCKGSNADPTIDPADPAYVLSDVAKVTVSRRTTDITITSQPEAFPETCAGTDKGITVKATGRGNLTCTWYSGSTAMTDPANGTIATTVTAIVPAPTNPLAADQELTSTFTPNAAGTYYCIIASTDNPGGVRSTQSVLTIHALPVLTDIPAGDRTQTLCDGTDLSVRVSASGVGVTYEWQKSTDGGANYAAFGETDSRLRTAVTGDALYRCVVKATCVEKAGGYNALAAGLVSSAVNVTMATKPGIAPAAGFTPAAFSKCEGESIGLVDANVTVTDNHKPVAAADRWWTLGGLQTANIYAVSRSDNGKTVGYSATNECGSTSVSFAAMRLSVDETPRVTQDPVDVQTVEDSRVRLSISASGRDLTYQWQKKLHSEGDDKWAAIDATGEPSAATAAYSFTAANITGVAFDGADVLTDYRCVVGTTNACGATTVPSAPVTVTVTRSKAAVSIRRQPAAYEVCNSEIAPYAPGFTVDVEGSGHFVYSWYEINDRATPVAQTPASGNIADAVAAKTNTFLPSVAGTYYCVITSSDDGVGVQTQAVTLTVSQAPAINNITPANATICEGGSVTLGVDATGSALTYQWYQQAGGAQAPATDTKKGSAPTFTPVGLTTTATFYCVVGSGSVCTGIVASASVVVTVQKAPKITVQPVSQSVCGGAGISLSVTATDADTYQWYHNGAATGANNAMLANVTDGGVYTCVVSMAGGVCGDVTSVPALITVAGEPEVSLGTAVAGMTATKDQLVTLPSPAVEANGSLIVPDKTGWYLSTADEATADLAYSYTVNTTATYRYKLTYRCSAAGAEQTLPSAGMPVFTVGLNDAVTITAQPVDATVCRGNVVSLSVSALGTGLSYSWESSADDGGTWSVVAPAVNGPVLNVTVTASLWYRCVVTSAGGTVATSDAAVVTVSAVPDAFALTQTGVLSGCERDEVTLEAIPDAGYWTLGGQPIGKPDNDKYKLNAADDGKVLRYVKTNLCGDRVSSNSRAVSVSREPRLTSVLATPHILQQGNALNLTAPANIGTLDAGYPKWTLDGKDGTAVTMGATVPALTDDGKLLTYSVSGCGFLDETSATLRVWDVPTFTGTGDRIVAGQVGFAYAYPAAPSVEMNNCTLLLQGWVEAGSNASAAFLDPSAAAKDADDGKQIVWQVRYQAPGGSATYVNSAVMGTFRPWDVPTFSGDNLTTALCAKEGAAWSFPSVSVNYNRTTSVPASDAWVDGTNVTISNTSNYTSHNMQLLYRKVAYKIPGDNTVRYAQSKVVRTLRPWKSPSFTSSASGSSAVVWLGDAVNVVPATYTEYGTTSTGSWVYGDSKTAVPSTVSSYLPDGEALYYRVISTDACGGGAGSVDQQRGVMQVKGMDEKAVIAAVPDNGKSYIMVDSRDSKEYLIKKIKGGQVWMVQNLDYGTCGTYNSTTSEGNRQEITAANGSKLYGTCRNSPDYGSAPKDHGKTYKYYNWQGAMQRSDTYYNSSAAPTGTIQGICPAGWHLPNKDEMQTMYNNVGSSANLCSTADNNQSWAGVLGGNVSNDGSFYDATSYGYYWSSSYYGTRSAYGLGFNSGGYVGPQHGSNKYSGLAVRCLKN